MTRKDLPPGRAATSLFLFAAAAVGAITVVWAVWESWRPQSPLPEERFVVDEPIVHIPKAGLVVQVTVQDAEDAVRVVEALQRVGVTAVALQAPQPAMPQAIGRARAALARRVLVGASGVHALQDVREAVRAGAEFVLMASLEPESVRVCQEARVLAIPGAFTATEIRQAWGLGTGLVALFPAGQAGPGYLREVLREAPGMSLLAAGGITPENAGEFIRAGAAAVVAIDDGAVGAARDHDAVARRARALVETIDRARARPVRSAPPARPIEGPDIR